MSRPNILLIVTDQQRRDTVGAFGSPICRTPAMDALAAQGMCFDRAYTPVGLCSPVRGSLFTGTYPHEHGVLNNVSLHPIRVSLPAVADRLTPALREAGYRRGYVGKWHVSEHETPLDFGFEDYYSLGDYVAWRREKNLPLPETFWNYVTQAAEVDPAGVENSRPAWLSDRAIELIDKYSAGGDAPFFLRLDFHGPHFPNVVPEPYMSMYPPAEIPPWPNFDDPLTDKPAVQRIKLRHWDTATRPWSEWAPLVAAYFGEISLIDSQVGRVLGHLDEKGLTDDTLVIWTTDHGDTCGSHRICNKDYTMYQEIYRVPMIMRWPGVIAPATRTSRYSHHFLDLFATFRDVVGAGLPEGCHGRSLLPILRGEPVADWSEEAFCQFHGCHMGLYTMRMLCNDRFSYIYHANDIDEFYDLEADPHELRNLAENPGALAPALVGMKDRMVDWMEATADHLHNEWTVMWLTDDPARAQRAPGRRRTAW